MLASRRLHRLGAVALGLALMSGAAKAEERIVNFYNWSNYMAPDVLGNFTGQTGIKVVYDTFDANETLETRLLAGKSGYDVVVPTAYFLTVDLSPLGLNETDEAFCKRIVHDYKVAAIPVSAFYEQDAVTSVVRFCFAKKDSTLDTALERLSDAVHRRRKVG